MTKASSKKVESEVKTVSVSEPIKKEKTVAKNKEVPMCRCGEEPRYLLTNRKTGKQYYWTLGPKCEKERQRGNRARKKARNTDLASVVSAKPAAILAKYDVQTVGELLKSQLDVTGIKGFGPKSQAALMAFIKESGLE